MGVKRGDDSLAESQSGVVDWDGPQDPEHPFNWPQKQRAIHIGLVTFINFVLNLAATLFAPAAQNLAVDFSVTDSTVLSLTVSIYLLGFAVGPLVVAPLSEVYGRLWVYHIVGPIIGGFVADNLGWRWTLWIVCIVSGISTTLCFLFMKETYAPVLLAAKARRLQKEPGNVSESTEFTKPTTLLLRAFVRPTKMLFLSPVVFGLSLFNAMVFGLIYLLFTTFPSVWRAQYGFSAGISGLCYLGLGVGMILAIGVFGALSDRLLEAKRKNGEAQPEHRLPLMIWTSPFLPAGLFWYGWAAEANIHWMVPIVGTSLIGFGGYFIVMPSQLYLVDAFGAQGAASALAALSVLRFIFGCFLPLAGPALYNDLGLGWGNSVLGFIAVAFIPVPIAFYKCGGFLRERFQVKL
ncbi:hypothetical protein SAPIO_CDS6127 [Scedosporium apiospermum]|uniref:Major facilitator superfamily (MFS) profile domain-containing protein n=1 Tax=Pseudallescheria apiosperma TaxID=563466 RepID=A0A084G4K6_PSEDA|nr:uncharacterized protein SAPIO_CDS6127 [Scedosporium apiospermum]KEZ42268.1 hypothetical protein SAPIO_CDS6127 [Scedosporium apiospermum]